MLQTVTLVLLSFAPSHSMVQPHHSRRTALRTGAAAASLFDSLASKLGMQPAAAAIPKAKAKGAKGATNEVVGVVDGIRQKRLGGGDIIVSEMGLGTQRWGSTDFNAPDEALCHQMMDRAILGGGINLVDTAEQYPIPSDRANPEGNTERIIGKWLAKDKSRRSKVVARAHNSLLHARARRTRQECLRPHPEPRALLPNRW